MGEIYARRTETDLVLFYPIFLYADNAYFV
jgi:hypothetical protein